MTVTSDIQDVSHATDGVSVDFAIPFYFLSNEHIVVDKIDANGGLTQLTYGTDFTLSGAGNPKGGTLTTLSVIGAGFDLHIYRVVPETQETEYQQNDPFPAKTTEKALDKLTMIAQQHGTAIKNSIRFPLSEYGRDGVLPPALQRASNILGFDAAGNLAMLPVPASVGAGDLRDEIFVAGTDFTPGVDSSVTLSRDYGTKANLFVSMDAAQQGPDTFSLNGKTLTFLDGNGNPAPIPNGIQKIYVKGGTTLSIEPPPDESITDAKIAPGSKLANRITGSIDVRDFGAVGDGVKNDTAAIQAAIDFAQSQCRTDYWSTYVPSVRIPAGTYLVRGLTISYPIHLHGDGQNATTLNLMSGSNASVIAITDMGGGLAGADNHNIMPIISDMSLNCNSSGQTPGGYFRGISLTDSTIPVGTNYHGGAELRNLNIRAATEYGVFIGANRNNGRMNNVKVLYSGSDAVYNSAYDWRIVDCDFGNSQNSNGYVQHAGGATEMVNCNIFVNKLSGLFLDVNVNASCLFANCYFDTNQRHGTVGIGSYGDVVSHAFVGCVWRDNSQEADNTYDQINLSNMTQVTIEGATFVTNIPSRQPRYLINTVNVTRVVFNATYEQNDTPNVPYRTGVTNNYLNLAIGGNENCSLATMGGSTVGVVGRNGARFDYYDPASLAGERRWRTQALGSVYSLYASDDAGNLPAGSLAFQVTRTGSTPNALQTISVQPHTDNTFPCGTAAYRWAVVYAATGVINTSDENQKEQIDVIPDAWLDAWADVDYFAFKFKDATAEKGADNARWHVGFVAQRVRDAFAKHGIDAAKIGLLCWDSWPAQPAVLDDEGNVVKPAIDAGEAWGIRYEEALAMEAALMRRELKKLRAS
ncbi:tail fiber domain-containing protein [Burkholderia multivorans]|uniref:glycosyl hydrolase family 28-related protein n=1 Tax=Burkholderia multivorans TaxID=87883 RepID=UPI0021D80D0C|nr:glycosyl hydrolase family 28-related protein [Burkholderia multivorans]UXZ62591.1 tail fiber domain-containing protein [Burkholderia multivorans]